MTPNTHRSSSPLSHPRCAIVPPYLLDRIARAQDPSFAAAAESARNSLLRDEPFRGIRDPLQPGVSWPESIWPSAARQRDGARSAAAGSPLRTISDAAGLEKLPGRTVRTEGAPPVADVAVNEAYEGLGNTYEMFWNAFGRDSIDGTGLPLDATVHFGERYDNAFWDGERMVFGDGDGQVFNRFTVSLSVIGHELGHGVTQHTAGLEYSGQSGALNESVSDVFGALVEQFSRRQSAAQASWLIGEGLFTAQVQGAALRSMSAPGTAYDDDVLGRDPQPDHMRNYVETNDDNGGVHINSGIPNRAFYLASMAIGGDAWERAGQIWFDALTAGTLSGTADFAAFAAATADAAIARYGSGSAEARAIGEAWLEVGVTSD